MRGKLGSSEADDEASLLSSLSLPYPASVNELLSRFPIASVIAQSVGLVRLNGWRRDSEITRSSMRRWVNAASVRSSVKPSPDKAFVRR